MLKKFIKRKDLIRSQAYIHGIWMESITKKTFDVKDPATGEILTCVPNMSENETLQAISGADAAFNGYWKMEYPSQRSLIFKKWHLLVNEHRLDLATIMTFENGKPIKESVSEVEYAASFIEYYANECLRPIGTVIPNPFTIPNRLFTIHQPIGVTGIITPWNFPLAMITRKVAPCLAAGCTAIVKPAPSTPLSALALAVLAEEAGIPSGVFNVITACDNESIEIGKILTSHKKVKKISFTGSTSIGKMLMKQSSSTIKKISLELGGNAPFIVFNDADIDLAVSGAIASKFRNNGQTCISVNRFYIHDNVYDEFVDKLVKKIEKLKIGHGLNKQTTIGPIINRKALNKVEYLVTDAVENGAVIAIGGKTVTTSELSNIIPDDFYNNEITGCFYMPTVLTNVTNNMKISNKEIFGPIAAIYKFNNNEEVIKLANSTDYGLAGYFYSKNIDQIWNVAEKLEYGMIGVNTGSISTVVAPFGGWKESGIGREGSRIGMEEYMETKYICIGSKVNK